MDDSSGPPSKAPWDSSTSAQYVPPERIEWPQSTTQTVAASDEVDASDELKSRREWPQNVGRELSDEEKRKMRELKAIRLRAKQMHWRSRQPARSLTAAERKEIQSRLYKVERLPGRPQLAYSHGSSSASVITSRGPALATAAQRAAALELSPSALAAAKVKARAKAEAAAWARALGADGSGGVAAASGGSAGAAGHHAPANGQPRSRPRSSRHAPGTAVDGQKRSLHADGSSARSRGIPRQGLRSQSETAPTGDDASLAPGWKQATSPEGKVYYYNVATNATQWTPPSLGSREARRQSGSSVEALAQGSAMQTDGGPLPGEDITPGVPEAPNAFSNDGVAVRLAKGTSASNQAPNDSNRTKRKKRRAKTSRALPSTRSPMTRRERYWNTGYVPTAVGTEPIHIIDQPAEGWVGTKGIPQRSSVERRHLNPMADIQLFAGGSRASTAKEVGVQRVGQQWKEGLRDFDKLNPVSKEEEEVEQLRVLLKRGQGIGTFSDTWTPYTGPGKEQLIEKVLGGLLHEAVVADAADETNTAADATDDANVNEPDDVLMLFRRYESSDKLNGNELKKVLAELGIAVESAGADDELRALDPGRLGLDEFRQLVEHMRQSHGVAAAAMVTPAGAESAAKGVEAQHAASPVVALELVDGGRTSFA